MDRSRDAYPQEWPSHLSHEADVGSFDGSPPAGCHTLQFDQLTSKQFEQLCWWLLQKDHEFVGCQLVGGNGKDQDGIDLFAFDRFEPSRLVVFQCKCWKKLPPSRLTYAVSKFLDGNWSTKAHRFVLVIAQTELDDLAKCWVSEEDRLKHAGLDAEIWPGTRLSNEIQRYPDIVSKFFPGALTQAYCDEWMRRVGFIERLQKAQMDRRPEISRIATEFLGQDSTEPPVTVIRNGRNWIVKRPWVYLSAMLPDRGFPTGSVLVIVHQPDVEGAMIVLSHKWLCANFIGNVGAPIAGKYRPFLSGQIDGSPPQHIVDLENARFHLPAECVQELAVTSDELTKVYLSALMDLEREWGAENFPFLASNQVALCTVPESLWRAILEFSQDHDFKNGETDWHIFDASLRVLKPCTQRDHANFDSGYHGAFYTRDRTNGLVYGNDVLIVWSPPATLAVEISARKWWPCDYALRWFESELLPAVGKWLSKRSARWRFPLQRTTEFDQWWKDTAHLGDVRLLPLSLGNRYRSLGLIQTIVELQAFFHGHGAQQHVYLGTNEIRKLYCAMIDLLHGRRGHAAYISGNLSLDPHCVTHEGIVEQLRSRILASELQIDSFILDYMLRAMLEAIKDDESWLNQSAKNDVFTALMPLMTFFDQELLIKRHCAWR